MIEDHEANACFCILQCCNVEIGAQLGNRDLGTNKLKYGSNIAIKHFPLFSGRFQIGSKNFQELNLIICSLSIRT